MNLDPPIFGKRSMGSNNRSSRRDFLKTTGAASAAFTIVPRHVLGGEDYVAPSETFGGALIGVGGCGPGTFSTMSEGLNVRKVAECDVRWVDRADNKTKYTLAQWQAAWGLDLNSTLCLSATSLFVDPANDDYHLLSTSPAVNAGTTLADVTDDIEGTSRPQGTYYDCGCYEYH